MTTSSDSEHNYDSILAELHDGVLTVDNFTHQICALDAAIRKIDRFGTKYSEADAKIKAVKSCLTTLAAKLPEPTKNVIDKLIQDAAATIVMQLHIVSRSPDMSLFDHQNGANYIHNTPLPHAHVSHKTSRKYALRKDKVDARDHVLQLKKPANLPASVDLRQTPWMPPVLDQGNAGSCAAHASANALHYLLRKEKVGDWPPSRLFIYYTTRVYIEHTPASEDSGVTIRDVCKALRAYHVCDEKFMPYLDTNIALKPSALAVANANLHKQIKYSAVPQTLQDIKTTLAAQIPILIGVQLYESFESDEVIQTGIVPMPDTAKEALLGGHALAIYGYKDDTKQFIVMNSWSSAIADKGFFYLPYNYVINPDLAADFWAIQMFD